MNLKIFIQTVGYLVAEIQTDDKQIKIGHSSYYGDIFQKFLNEVFLIYNGKKNEDESFFPYSFELTWFDDRVNHLWAVNIGSINSPVEIEIFELSPIVSSYKESIFKDKIAFEDFYDNIYFSLEKMLRDFGFIGYKTNWEVGNFPIYEYVILKSDKLSLKLEKEEVGEDEEWKSKNLLENELKLILTCSSENV